MKKFIYKSVYFIFVTILGYLLVLILIIGLNRYKYSGFALNDDNITGLIFGDSHTHWALIDDSIPNIKNLSLNAEGYIFTFAKLRYILEKQPNVDKVYIGFSYHNLSSFFDDYMIGDHSDHLISRYIALLSLEEYLFLLSKNPWKLLTWGNFIIRDGLLDLVSQKDSPRFVGIFPGEVLRGTLDIKAVDIRIKEQYYNEGKIVPFSLLNLKYLDRMINLCYSKNIQVTLINTPLNKLYVEKVPDEFKNKLDAILTSYDVNYLDFCKVEVPDSFFLQDGDHLNYSGAILTTRFFNSYFCESRK